MLILNRSSNIHYSIHISVALCLGVLMYAYRVFKSDALPEWLLYSLPDGLWLYAFLSAITYIWKDNPYPLTIWVISIVSGTTLSEILQAFQILKGTFDWNDLSAYGLALLAFLLPHFKIQPKHTQKKPSS